MKKYSFIALLFLVVPICVIGQTKSKKTVVQSSVAPVFLPTTATERLESYAKKKAGEGNSIVKNLNFRSIGPTVMSGRVVDIEVNPDSPTEFYVAYASGGLWHTQNNGQSFTPIFDKEAAMTIGDVAVDWKHQIIWVGTGENNSSRSTYAGMGIYKSVNNGKTWQHLGLADTQHIGRIALHPTNPEIAWVAAVGHLYSYNLERGVFKTADGGKTWRKTLFISEKTGVIDIQINPENPEILFAAAWQRERKAWNFSESGVESGIYKSANGGEKWEMVSGGNSGFPQTEGTGRIGLAIYPQNPEIMYAILDNQSARPTPAVETKKEGLTKSMMKTLTKADFLALDDAQVEEYLKEEGFPERFTAKLLKELISSDKNTVKDIYDYTHNGNDDLFDIQIVGPEIYKSNDAGKTWKRTHSQYLDGLYYTYGYYFGQIWVAPHHADQLVVAGVPILKSEDGGQTFFNIEGDNVHSDHHAIWINPQNSSHIINGNDGGINITYDSGKHWFKANSPAVGQFYSVSVDMAQPYQIYGGLQDNGVWQHSSKPEPGAWFDGGNSSKFLLGGDGMMVQVDWRDNNLVYTGFQFGNYFRINKTTGERKYIQVPRQLGEEALRFNWEAPILLSRHNQDVLYYGSHKFHRSLDKAETWKTLSGDLTRGRKDGDVPYGTLTTIEESPLRFGLIYTGSDDGLVFVSKDGGQSFSKIADYPHLWVSSICASPFNEATVYITLNGYREDNFKPYLLVSHNYGQSWQFLADGLPAEAINVVKLDPVNPDLLFVGTDHGLYLSLDKGISFHNANGNMPAVAIHDLAIHPRENELIVATHGRSVWVADIKPIQGLSAEVLNQPLYVFHVPDLPYHAKWGKVESFESPKKIKQTVTLYSKVGGNLEIELKTDSGLVVKKWSEELNKGLNTIEFEPTLSETVQDNYGKYLTETTKKEVKIKPAEDKKIYLHPGKYKLVLLLGEGKAEKDWRITPPKSQTRRGSLPTGGVSPDQFEQWYEEKGFEELKK